MFTPKIQNQNSSLKKPDHFKIHLAAVCFALILISIFIPSASQTTEAKLQPKAFYSEINISSDLKVVKEFSPKNSFVDCYNSHQLRCQASLQRMLLALLSPYFAK